MEAQEVSASRHVPRRAPIPREQAEGAFIPIVEQQKQFLESMRRDLVDLGLERFKKPPEPLEEYLRRRSGASTGGENGATEEGT
jgi:hypothetical protein